MAEGIPTKRERHRALVEALYPSDQPTPDQVKAGQEHGLPDALATRLRGDTPEALEADAKALATALQEQQDADVPEHVLLARRAIEAAKNNPNVAELQALAQSGAKHRLYGTEEGEDS